MSVPFDITAVPTKPGGKLFLATYASGVKTARFKIELKAASPMKQGSGDAFDFSTGEGALLAEPGSDNSEFLTELKKALEAKHIPTKVNRVAQLPFTYAVLGVNQSQIEGGGFTNKRPGHWTAMKIFFPNGDDDCEVFLNYNAATQKAQFSEKDSDYGDCLVAKLAGVV